MKLGIVATTVAAALLAAGLVASPAHAEQVRYADPADATASLTDIRGVLLDHRASAVVVKVGFTDLRRSSTAGPSGLTVYLDTVADRSGPEFLLTSGLQAGTDYQLLRTRGGRPYGDPLSCPHKLRLDFAADRLVFAAARTCLGSPERVRISVKMRDEWDSSHPVTDWLGAPRSWTDRLVSS